jgi:hypothetical protein
VKPALTVPQATASAEPRWLSEVRLRAGRRVLWLRHLWSAHRYEGEQLLAITHSEVDRILSPLAGAAEAEQAFYRSDERAATATAQIAAIAERPADAMLEHLASALGLSPAEVALFTLALAAALDPAIPRAFGYLLDRTDAADPTPALAASVFELSGQALPGPGKPLKKLPQTDAIFANIAAVKAAARGDPSILEISMDTKAKVALGDYSRGGKNPDRCGGAGGESVGP